MSRKRTAGFSDAAHLDTVDFQQISARFAQPLGPELPFELRLLGERDAAHHPRLVRHRLLPPPARASPRLRADCSRAVIWRSSACIECVVGLVARLSSARAGRRPAER